MRTSMSSPATAPRPMPSQSSLSTTAGCTVLPAPLNQSRKAASCGVEVDILRVRMRVGEERAGSSAGRKSR